MDMNSIRNFTEVFLEITGVIFTVGVFLLVFVIIYMYIVDVTQTSQTIRRNYPVVGRFRYFFEHMGEFFRQYFFAQDREELPFNRAQRSWAYRAAKNVDSTVAFGSTHALNLPGDYLFLNGFIPPLDEEFQAPSAIVFGEGFAAMSYGALSGPAVRALSLGAKQAGIWLNTGEGGISPFHLEGGCDIVFQMGTAKYGVRDEQGKLCDQKLRAIASHEQVRMIEIKLSQGAKPGKGGILPGGKVTEIIAMTRGIPVGEDSISPNRHKDIGSIDDLLNMIHRVREVTGKPVGIKAVIGAVEWLEEICLAINTRGLQYAPDFITVDSADGAGALCLGADCVNSARGFMFALGCIQALQCNKNTCPTGITTHDEDLQRGLVPKDKAVRVADYAKNIMHEVAMIAHSCGVVEPRLLNRSHVRIINEAGVPIPLSDFVVQ